MKQTPLNKMISDIEERINYLIKQELNAIAELDSIDSPIFRDMKWKLINELAARRNELEMYSLKPLQSLLPYEMECIEGAYDAGWHKCHNKNYDSAKIYFNATFKQ